MTPLDIPLPVLCAKLTTPSIVTQRIVTEGNQKQNYWCYHEHGKMNAKKLCGQGSRKVVRPLFQESTKEGAMTYVDWCEEVEEYITKGFDDQKIKDVMFTSMEGKAMRKYQACDEKGNLSLTKILVRMDMIYSTSVTFWDLNVKLCTLKQGPYVTLF